MRIMSTDNAMIKHKHVRLAWCNPRTTESIITSLLMEKDNYCDLSRSNKEIFSELRVKAMVRL